MNLAAEQFSNFLLNYADVVGKVVQVHPIRNFTNKYNQQKSSITFTINDITSAFLL